MTEHLKDTDTARKNRRVAVICAGVFCGMVGLSFAAVPFYDLFCRVTGYGGTPKRTDQYSDVILDRTITVRFDANVAPGLPWQFRPKQRQVELRIGETTEAHYIATNIADTNTAGTASFNVQPELAGAYFNKVQCFCFTEQDLEPGQSIEMPVQFFVDPEIVNVPELKNIKTITLSYTFHPLTKATAEAPAQAAKERIGG
ncbi:cytochrome c oxidase assembly protein [Chelativorans composti]|jgi:Cytochrome oxidase assembly factor|uniref:Cytochrome c oxidase assembly protein CtaG n=1 Tax=Chelativorans composti TaxID=768533 RepID=A0ABW5DF57_9HYPH